jgi:hypothetical protein
MTAGRFDIFAVSGALAPETANIYGPVCQPRSRMSLQSHGTLCAGERHHPRARSPVCAGSLLPGTQRGGCRIRNWHTVSPTVSHDASRRDICNNHQDNGKQEHICEAVGAGMGTRPPRQPTLPVRRAQPDRSRLNRQHAKMILVTGNIVAHPRAKGQGHLPHALFHALRESGQFYNSCRPHRGLLTPRP